MNNNKYSTLKFITGEDSIYGYMAHHKVEFNLVEFYEISEKHLKEYMVVSKMPLSEYKAHLRHNLKQLTDFNASYRPRSRRRARVTQVHPAEEMTLGLPLQYGIEKVPSFRSGMNRS